jgi:hypothetical protein
VLCKLAARNALEISPIIHCNTGRRYTPDVAVPETNLGVIMAALARVSLLTEQQNSEMFVNRSWMSQKVQRQTSIPTSSGPTVDSPISTSAQETSAIPVAYHDSEAFDQSISDYFSIVAKADSQEGQQQRVKDIFRIPTVVEGIAGQVCLVYPLVVNGILC